MILNKPYTTRDYSNLAIYANLNRLIISDKGDYLETEAQYTDEELAQIEADRISALEQTRGDVFRAVFKAFGVKRDTLRAMIENYEITEEFTEEDKELALIDFDEGLNFIRGNELIDAMGAQLGVSSTQMDKFFETNDYTELTKLEDVAENEESSEVTDN